MRAHKADTNGNREGVCAAAKNSGGERGEGRLQADGAYLSLPCSRRSGDCAPSVTRPRRGIRVPGLGLGRHSRGQQAAEARPGGPAVFFVDGGNVQPAQMTARPLAGFCLLHAASVTPRPCYPTGPALASASVRNAEEGFPPVQTAAAAARSFLSHPGICL